MKLITQSALFLILITFGLTEISFGYEESLSPERQEFRSEQEVRTRTAVSVSFFKKSSDHSLRIKEGTFTTIDTSERVTSTAILESCDKDENNLFILHQSFLI